MSRLLRSPTSADDIINIVLIKLGQSSLYKPIVLINKDDTKGRTTHTAQEAYIIRSLIEIYLT